jgi:NAD(P) transhydrogenase subunit beta
MALSAPVGAVAARRVKMTAMPQMVALFNGVGGGAAALVALADFTHVDPEPGRIKADVGVSIMLSALIGGISFAGSLVAFAKLQELVSGRPIVYPGQKVLNAALLAALAALAVVVLVACVLLAVAALASLLAALAPLVAAGLAVCWIGRRVGTALDGRPPRTRLRA